MLRVLGARNAAQALGGDGADRRQGILDAVVQFLEDQLLKLVRRLALSGVNAGLSQQVLGVDFGLRQQQPKADVFRRQELPGRRFADAELVVVLMKVDFKHHRPYHHMSGPAQIN